MGYVSSSVWARWTTWNLLVAAAMESVAAEPVSRKGRGVLGEQAGEHPGVVERGAIGEVAAGGVAADHDLVAVDVEMGLDVGDGGEDLVLIGVGIPAVVLAAADGDRDVALTGAGRDRVDVAGPFVAAAVHPDEQLDRRVVGRVIRVRTKIQ
jgi:hypothetical protein